MKKIILSAPLTKFLLIPLAVFSSLSLLLTTNVLSESIAITKPENSTRIIMFLWDLSGSMNNTMDTTKGSVNKFRVSKGIIKTNFAEMKNDYVGLITFGEESIKGCEAIKYRLPLSKGISDSQISSLLSFGKAGNGETPIAKAMRRSRVEITKFLDESKDQEVKSANKSIIIISDGFDSCDGTDAICREVDELKRHNIFDQIHVVGLDLPQRVLETYTCQGIDSVLNIIEDVEPKIEIDNRPKVSTLKGKLPDPVLIKGGTFRMGSNKGDNDEKPEHDVRLDTFRMDPYEVRARDYAEFLNEYYFIIEVTGKFNRQSLRKYVDVDFPGEKERPEIPLKIVRTPVGGEKVVPKSPRDNHPVTFVTWYGADAFCTWIDRKLPTEAQWEYAASDAGKNIWAFGNVWEPTQCNNGNYRGPLESMIFPLHLNMGTINTGTFLANRFAVYDLTGNVMEWCDNWYYGYPSKPNHNPTGPPNGGNKVYRGGSWNQTNPMDFTTSNRWPRVPYTKQYDIGFRCVENFK